MFVILVPNLTAILVLRPNDNTPLLGRNYTLECKHTQGPDFDSSKFNFTYEWFEVLRKDDKRKVKEKGSSISFQPFKLPDVGIYYCKVTLSCDGKTVDEKETEELDMASIGMITHQLSCYVLSHTQVRTMSSIFQGHTSKLCIVAVIGFWCQYTKAHCWCTLHGLLSNSEVDVDVKIKFPFCICITLRYVITEV